MAIIKMEDIDRIYTEILTDYFTKGYRLYTKKRLVIKLLTSMSGFIFSVDFVVPDLFRRMTAHPKS